MGSETKIEWTRGADGGAGATWTPIRARNKSTGKVGWHCEHATHGCQFCYAEGLNIRLGTGLPFKPGHRRDIEIFLDEKMLLAPLKWKKPKKIFVCSMTDAFAHFVRDEWLDKMFAVAVLAPQHVLQWLTKRSDRMRAWASDPETPKRVALAAVNVANLAADAGIFKARAAARSAGVEAAGPPQICWPLPNVMLGVSCEDQARADERVPDLLATPAAVRFVSYEPALGPIDFTRIVYPNDFGYDDVATDALRGMTVDAATGADLAEGARGAKLDWIIAGGESGPRARPMHPDWARGIRDDCARAVVPFFFKQHGEFINVRDLRELPGGRGPGFGAYDHCAHDMETDTVRVGKKRAGRLLDGREHNEMPGCADDRT